MTAGELAPDLATGLGEPNADKTVWTYRLRPGLKFSTGDPITSADIKYGFERMWATDVISGGPSRYFLCLLDTCDAEGAPTYQGPYKDPDRWAGLDRDAGRADDRVPPDRVVRRLRLPDGDAGDRAGAALGRQGRPLHATRWSRRDRSCGSRTRRGRAWCGCATRTGARRPTRSAAQGGQGHADPPEQPRRPRRPAEERLARPVRGRRRPADVPVRDPQHPDPEGERGQPGQRLRGPVRDLPVRPPLDNVHCRRAIAYALDKRDLLVQSGGSYGGDYATTLLPPAVPGHDPRPTRTRPAPTGPATWTRRSRSWPSAASRTASTR